MHLSPNDRSQVFPELSGKWELELTEAKEEVNLAIANILTSKYFPKEIFI